MRSKETGKLFSETAPNARDVVTVKSGGKLLEAMVIATGEKRCLKVFISEQVTVPQNTADTYKMFL
ncbi:unnamed protein product [Porites evermanni]|uniref:Uncharacterized protein n=1 Tax=Porites evermanni TaxID=104178 RepID=A0ABN8RWW3_9CNID|nr:unnamed protein product [Porites evermanni]